MRAIPVASVTLLGACALSACVPANAAIDGITPFGFSVLPSTVEPGGEVTLRVDRHDGECKGPATVSSPVFDTVTIPRRQSWAQTEVDRDARPGAVYKVTFRCDGATGTTDLTITGHHGQSSKSWQDHDGKDEHDGQGGRDGRDDYTGRDGHDGQAEYDGHGRHDGGDGHRDYPQKGVHAGEGGSFGDFDLGEIGLGAALVAGAVGTAYHLSRRRTAEEGG
ncbi:hypothetical protein [Streptomyces poriticola]|uniref:hypothetical protein n=1 Tax=Streptomyces poriticola TaxID=3120506 RepID=UPI002FCDF1AD